MFESSAPKYKFGGAGGSNENVSSAKKDVPPLRKLSRRQHRLEVEQMKKCCFKPYLSSSYVDLDTILYKLKIL